MTAGVQVTPAITRFRAMNTDVTLQVVDPHGLSDVQQALDLARRVFGDVEKACTRFDPGSALMRANAAGSSWFQVPPVCFDAIAAAALAHLETGGLFDPRVLESLVALGYDRTLSFGGGALRLSAGRSPSAVPALSASVPPSVTRWRPEFDPDRGAVQVGPRPIDLGGIGKGLAVGWAAQVLERASQTFLVEAGGDCVLGGKGLDGDGWKVGIEDPFGGAEGAGNEQPVAVLSLADIGCGTSSLRKRTWQLDGQQVHHLIDPRTGRSAAGGLRSVTVVDPDPARAEVWSKALLIAGSGAIAGRAAERGLAALWVDDEGRLGMSEAMVPSVVWRATDVR